MTIEDLMVDNQKTVKSNKIKAYSEAMADFMFIGIPLISAYFIQNPSTQLVFSHISYYLK